MAFELDTVLAAVRSDLQTATAAPVYLRDSLPLDADGDFVAPTAARHVILDLIPGAPANGFDGTLYEDLILQIGAWSSTSLTDAIALAELCRADLHPAFSRTGGTQFQRDHEYRGVIFTVTQVAAFQNYT